MALTTHFLDTWPKRAELIALYTADTDMTVAEMAKRLGISSFSVRGYAHALGLHRHPATIKRQRTAIGARNREAALQAERSPRAKADWPPHSFAGQEDPRAVAECTGNFKWLKPPPNATQGGVASGWGNGATLGLSRTGARAGAA